MGYLLANLVGFLALAGLFYCSGLVLDRTLAAGRGLLPLPGPGRWAAGAALWMAVLFVLAASGLLKPLYIALTLVLLLGGLLASRRFRAGATAIVDGSRSAGGEAARAVLAAGVGLVLVALWVQAQWPQLSWDADVYHLTVPRLYLEHGGFRRIPFSVYSNWPLNVELLFGLAMLVKDYVLAKLVHFAFGCATVWLIYRLAAAASRPWAGWLAAALFLANPVVLSEFRAAYVDIAYAFYFTLAFAYLHSGLEQAADRRRQLLMAGIFGGIAAGIRPTGFVAPACLAVVLLAVATRRRDPPPPAFGDLSRLLLPASLLLAPWLIKSWLLTGNPVYPFLYGVFDGPEWSPELSTRLRDWQLGIGMGRGWRDYLLLPLRVIVAGDRGYEHFDGRLLPLWLPLLPIAVWAARGRALVGRCLGLAAIYFVIWALSSQQMRFLIAVLPALAVGASVGLAATLERLPPVWGSRARLAVSLVAVAALALAEGRLLPQSLTMLRQYLQHDRAIAGLAVRPIYRDIDRELPPSAKLMFLNTNHGFFCRREFIADSFFEASQINDLMQKRDSAQEIGRLLEELGVTHLLIENRERFVPWPPSLFEFLNDPRRARLLIRTRDGTHDLVEVLAAAAEP